jgi:dihydropteroate synthase-like protein
MAEAGQTLFVTGRLAEPSLRRVITALAPPFEWSIAVMKITVAALMTTEWIGRFLMPPEGTARIIIPGLCEGDPAPLAEQFGVPVEKGPKDLRDLPEYFGRQPIASDYGVWDIEILAEINNAGRLSIEEVVREAEHYRASGADLIDIGCTPGQPFPALGAVIRRLREAGLRVSIDSFDRSEIRAAVEAGAEMVLSVNTSNLDVVDDLAGSGARVVAIPALGGTLDSLDPTVEALARRNVEYLIDPILEPIGHGFTASIGRYAEARRRYPDAEMLMGIGNLTELTAADSTGVNALLIAICEELGIRSVLTTEVIPWARGAVREVDVARRLMHYAISHQTIPKGIDNRLVTTRDAVVHRSSEQELRELQQSITDPNFRIFLEHECIVVFNNTQFVRGRDPGEIFSQLSIDEPSHAFYLGRELCLAHLALVLGKAYQQDAGLSWGYLTPSAEPAGKKVRLTQRTTQRK